MKIISLGWGVQSWTLVAMVALGELEPIDYAVHSDTTWEMSYTYEFAKQWTPWLEERGVKVVTVSDPIAPMQASDNSRQSHSPFYTIKEGKEGQLRRSCTQRWKITPIRRFETKMLAERGLKKTPGVIEQWMGITFDEVFRAKVSDVKYITNRFPFLEMKWTRQDCLLWLGKHGLPSPGKSSCTFCPYHNKRMWQNMKRENGEDWEQAVDVDMAIRDKRPPYPLFVHSARVPLPEAVKIPEDEGYVQPELFDTSDICDSGYCFL